MKKNLFLGLCAAGMLLTTSCSQENFFTELWGGEKEQTVTLSVAVPEMQTSTRAYGTGVNATNLQYAVYSLDAQDNLNEQIALVDNVTLKGTPLQAKINLKLVPGTKYSIVLWADAYGKNGAGSPFTIVMNETTTTMTVAATTVKTNDDMTDAFFGSFVIEPNTVETSGYVIEDAITGETLSNTTLQLKRPFAQLNIAATNSDLELAEKSDFEITKTAVKIENAYSSMDLRSGNMLGSETAIQYVMNDVPGTMQTSQVDEYTLLAMNYILMSADKSTEKVTFTYSDGTTTRTKEYANVPLRRNWRTNIYGDLFTNPVDIIVEIAPNFADQTSEDEDNGASDGDSDNNDMYDVDATEKDNTTTNP